MTSNDEQIEQIKAKGPALYYTRRQKVDRVLLYVLVVAVFLIGAGYFINREANHNTATCVNSNLGDRASVATSDYDVDQAYITAQKKFADSLVAVLFSSGETQQELFTAFKNASRDLDTATTKYQTTRAANQAYRNAHPVGKCG